MSAAPGPFEHRPAAAFRGAREYVHSTDLYEEIVSGAAGAGLAFEGPIELRIRARLTRSPVYAFAPGTQAPDRHASATCTFRSGATQWAVAVTESAVPVTARRPYDESPATRCSRVEGTTIRLTGPTGLRPIECVTALGVALHRASLPPPEGKRWLLGQLTLSRPLTAEDAAHMQIALARTAGGAITRASVIARDGVIGTMVFLLA